MWTCTDPALLPPLPPNHPVAPYEPNFYTLRREHAYSFSSQNSGMTSDQWRRYLYAYYRLVEKADAVVGRLISSLEETGFWNDTVVIFTSDHGDMRSAHMMLQKGVLYDEAARVPLIISGGAAARRPGGTVMGRADSTTIVEQGRDVYATILDYAGVGRQDGMPRKHAVCETRSTRTTDRLGFLVHGRMVRTAQFKDVAFSRGPHREQLFDIESDPGEMVNLAGIRAYDEELRRHRSLLREWCERTGDTFGGGHYARPGVPFIVPGDAYPTGPD